jgi:hypothetical protein
VCDKFRGGGKRDRRILNTEWGTVTVRAWKQGCAECAGRAKEPQQTRWGAYIHYIHPTATPQPAFHFSAVPRHRRLTCTLTAAWRRYHPDPQKYVTAQGYRQCPDKSQFALGVDIGRGSRICSVDQPQNQSTSSDQPTKN